MKIKCLKELPGIDVGEVFDFFSLKGAGIKTMGMNLYSFPDLISQGWFEEIEESIKDKMQTIFNEKKNQHSSAQQWEKAVIERINEEIKKHYLKTFNKAARIEFFHTMETDTLRKIRRALEAV